jgi:hypothetical protein
MEIAGFAIGGAGHVGAFKTTRVSAAKAYGREYELFISLLGQERDRLQI